VLVRHAQWKINQSPSLKRERAVSDGWEGRPCWSSAPGARALRRSTRGRTRQSPVLVQRAVSEDPRWTRALGDHLACPQRGRIEERCTRRPHFDQHGYLSQGEEASKLGRIILGGFIDTCSKVHDNVRKSGM
jgi:hypothetical protein